MSRRAHIASARVDLGVRVLSLLLVLGAAACGGYDERPYLIDEPRVLGIVAAPPSIVPDERATLTAYVAGATLDDELAYAWTYCPQRGDLANAPRCERPVALAASEPIEIAPGLLALTTEHAVTSDELASVPPLALMTGFWEHVRLSLVPGNAAPFDAIKRLVVSDGSQGPNTNPALDGVDVSRGRASIDPATPLPTRVRVRLTPRFDASTLESYSVLGIDGRWHGRSERATFTWYVTGGSLDRWVSDEDSPTVAWTLPTLSGAPQRVAHAYAVLRDGRGGTAVATVTLILEE